MEKINGNSLLMKEVNINIVRNALRNENTATKQYLSKITGLSIVTISSILQQLLQNGEIYEDELISSNGGRPAHTFCYNKNFLNILTVCTHEENGIDKAFVCVKNILGEILEKKEFLLKNPDIYDFERITKEFTERYSKIKAIGFSMPGVENDGKIILHDYKKLNGVKFREYFEKIYNIPIVLENDVNSAVIGYCKNMKEKKENAIVYIYFPQKYPAGAGICINKKIYKGFNGTAGEIKYMPLGIDWENLDYSQEKNVIETVSKIITAISAILNPQKIVVYGDIFTNDNLKKIEKRCENMSGKIFTAKIYLSESFIKDFEEGITEITLDLLTPKLSLQNI